MGRLGYSAPAMRSSAQTAVSVIEIALQSPPICGQTSRLLNIKLTDEVDEVKQARGDRTEIIYNTS